MAVAGCYDDDDGGRSALATLLATSMMIVGATAALATVTISAATRSILGVAHQSAAGLSGARFSTCLLCADSVGLENEIAGIRHLRAKSFGAAAVTMRSQALITRRRRACLYICCVGR